MAKGTYFGGSSVVNKGSYGDPEGRGATPKASPKLKGSARLLDQQIASRLPPLQRALGLLVTLNDRDILRLQNIKRVKRYASMVSSLRGQVGSAHRAAYDCSRQLIQEVSPIVKRQLIFRKHPPEFVRTVIRTLQSVLTKSR